MGKRRIIAETGAGQHGVATATVCALLGFECVVYMGEEDMRRQRLNVFRMRLLGANVVGVANGSATLKDAISEAMRDWVTNVGDTYYLLGSALGSHPYPMMVRDFHRVIGEEARRQILEAEGRLPDAVIACVGGGSNAIGLFHAFLDDAGVRLIGVEAGGRGERLGDHAARYRGGAPGVLQGAYSYLLQDEDGQVALTHSVSAGLDYAMIGPEHAWLRDQGRAEYVAASDGEALDAAKRLSRTEGIMPALECAHAVAEAIRRAPAADGQNLPGEPLRPRRQGHRYLPRKLSGAGSAVTRIGRLFECLKRENRKALIAYLTAGDPSPERTPALVDALERGGADLIELGVPFTDPIADGPVIQRAGERALKAGTTLHKVLEIARRIRATSEVPLLLFTYLNPVLRYGLERLAADAAAARNRRLPAHRCQRGRGRGLRRGHASPRSGHGLPGRAHQHGAAAEAGGAVLHRLRLPGLAHRRDRRAGLALRVRRAADPEHARRHRPAAGGGLRHLEAGACGRTGAAGGSGGGGQRHRARDRAARRAGPGAPSRSLRPRAEARLWSAGMTQDEARARLEEFRVSHRRD